jgi:hypothetical protein
MKYAAVLAVAIACSCAFASEPGQPLDCSDWIITEPGISCGVAIPPDCASESACIRGVPIVSDNVGRLLYIRGGVPIGNCGPEVLYRTAIVARSTSAPGETLIATINDRCNPAGGTDSLAPNESSEPPDILPIKSAVVFDPAGGRLLVPVRSYTRGGTYSSRVWLASLGGFATTFEVLQSFTPQATLGFRVPYMPEGMGGAYHFDTYWGSLAHPIDFTQAHPLACDYPAAAPHVGDYLTVADTLRTPAPGQGVYFVTATTYQGQTRYGRKCSGGKLIGRDPALLPACVPPSPR